MKLTARVQLNNRMCPSLAITPRPPERATLIVGNTASCPEEIYLLVKTVKNPQGEKFKLRANVTCILTRFLNEGKATVSLKQPPFDVFINAEKASLTNFIVLLKKVIQSKSCQKSLSTLNVTCLTSDTSKVDTTLKKRLKINGRDSFRHRDPYPRSLEHLSITNAGVNKFDPQILRLQNLRVLSLEGNNLAVIPPEIDLLPNLRELNLKSNALGASHDWKWMKSTILQSSLVALDLSSNGLLSLPRDICRFKNLRSLYLSNNQLEFLPRGFGLLKNLKECLLTRNELCWLPPSFLHLRLDTLDTSFSCGAPQVSTFDHLLRNIDRPSFSLLSLSAAVVLKFKLPFCPVTLPRCLVEYLEDSYFCICGTPTYPPIPEHFIRIPTEVSKSRVLCQKSPSIAVKLCSSQKCKKKIQHSM